MPRRQPKKKRRLATERYRRSVWIMREEMSRRDRRAHLRLTPTSSRSRAKSRRYLLHLGAMNQKCPDQDGRPGLVAVWMIQRIWRHSK